MKKDLVTKLKNKIKLKKQFKDSLEDVKAGRIKRVA